MYLHADSRFSTASDARMTHRELSSEEHITEATHLLIDIPEMVAHGRYGWGSPEATNMLAAAMAHIRLAGLKADLMEK
jgi:hypothetical protein